MKRVLEIFSRFTLAFFAIAFTAWFWFTFFNWIRSLF